MANTMKLIATLGGGASTIDFTSIPSTYTDLILVHSLRFSSASGIQNVNIRFNNDSGANYTQKMILANDGNVNTYVQTSAVYFNWNYAPGGTGSTTANAYNSTSLYIPNYANTSTSKPVSIDHVSEINSTTNYGLGFTSGVWNSTSAINRITITAPSDTWTSASSAYLYGIKNS
jgi:hypothetical protein